MYTERCLVFFFLLLSFTALFVESVAPLRACRYSSSVFCILQKDTDHAVVVAVAAQAVFEPGLEDDGDQYRVGVASTLLKVRLVFLSLFLTKVIAKLSCLTVL